MNIRKLTRTEEDELLLWEHKPVLKIVLPSTKVQI